MTEQHIIRRPDPGARHRHRVERRMSLGATNGIFAHPADALVPAGPVPHLALPEPEAGRNTLLSAGLSALFHASILAAILLAGYMAPEEALKVIPLAFVEAKPLPPPVPLPPSPEPTPAARPRTITSRIPPSAPRLASPAPVQPTVAPTTRTDVVSPQVLDMARVATAPTPTRVAPTQMKSQQLTAHTTTVSRQKSAADVVAVRDFQVDPEALKAPTADLRGPTKVNTRAPTATQAPTGFKELARTGSAEYVPMATPTTATAGTAGTAVMAKAGSEIVETGVPTEFQGLRPSAPGGSNDAPGGEPGATGTGTPSVSCLRSSYVNQYLQLVKERTEGRWQLPEDAAPDEQAILRFKLDWAGAASDVEIEKASTTTFGSSARRALSEASPFPPMNDNVRCLIEKKIKLTFRHPAT